MRPFEELVAEAAIADTTGWRFDYLAGRATEERPPWGYVSRLSERLQRATAALDLDTGGGEVLAECPLFPPRMAVTEGWPPNLARAREVLGPRGVHVVQVPAQVEGEALRLPFDDASFDLVSARHPVSTHWAEVARVLTPGGTYFAQHVGAYSARELSEAFLGPLPQGAHARDPAVEAAAAKAAGLTLVDVQSARCRMEFFDVGAVVWILRKCPWWVPDFDVGKYETELWALAEGMRAGTPFVSYSTRHLFEIRKE